MWKIELYESQNKDTPVLDFISKLEKKLKAKVWYEIDLLEEFGINLGYPHTKKIKGNKYKHLWEFRVRYSSNDIRIIYFLCLRDKFVLLHGFKKKKNYTPGKELETARKRMLDYKNRKGFK